MKSFAELIQEGTIKDVAASSYSCKRVPIDDIAGKSIVILNIVENIKTEKGEGRTLVHFQNRVCRLVLCGTWFGVPLC